MLHEYACLTAQILYNAHMPYEWDEAKRLSSLAKHRVDFESIYAFDWQTAVIDFHDRHDEPRWEARGFIGVVLYTVGYTWRGENIRVISLRKSSPKEIMEYAQT